MEDQTKSHMSFPVSKSSSEKSSGSDIRRATLPPNFMSGHTKDSSETQSSDSGSEEGSTYESGAGVYARFRSFPELPDKPQLDPEPRPSQLLFTQGISTQAAAAFMASVIASNGVLEMPKALSSLGWLGTFFFILMFWNAMYSSLCLGECMRILEQRWPDEYRKDCRNPYPSIAYRAIGLWMKYIVAFLIDISLIFVCVTHLLVASSVMGDLLRNQRFCYWLIVLAFLYIPMTWYRTPRRFWWSAVLNVVVTEIAILMMMVHIAVIRRIDTTRSYFPVPLFKDVVQGMGCTAVFFGGTAVWPTIHNEMQSRADYFDAVVGGYVGALMMYLPLTFLGYAGFGHKVSNNILRTIDSHSPHDFLSMVHDLLFVVHLTLSFVVILNPVMQDFEEFIKCPRKFSYVRCLLRSAVVVLILIISLSQPSLSLVLKMVVGLSSSCLTFVFPPIFYVILLLEDQQMTPRRKIGKKEIAILIEVIFMGLILTGTATYVPPDVVEKFVPVSCYRNMSARELIES